jgi:hypothetical protein
MDTANSKEKGVLFAMIEYDSLDIRLTFFKNKPEVSSPAPERYFV